MRTRYLAFLALATCLAPAANAGWTALNHQPPVNMYAYMVLQDGRILCNQADSSGLGTTAWYTLTPDTTGSYLNGTWTKVASSVWTHLYFGTGVTADGKILIAGGEYSTGGQETTKCELYDPNANTWSNVTPPAGWTYVGDASSTTLADGRIMIGNILDQRTAFFDPNTLSFTPGANMVGNQSNEESWVLLPDGTIGTWNCFGHPLSQRYLPTQNQWISCGNTPVDLVLPNSLETGPGIVMPDGRMFAIGATPHTALYQYPSVLNQTGTWTVGPTPPTIGGRTIGAEDAPACLMPNGNVLLCLGPVTAGGGSFEPPTYFFEFDGTNLNRIADAPSNSKAPYFGRLQILPSGEALWTNGSTSAYIYSNGGSPNPAWKPTITSSPAIVEKGTTSIIGGTQFCGVSNGANYGDEYDPASNYPLTRLTDANSGTVTYQRTHHPSTRQIQTGNQTVTASVDMTAPAANYHMQVVANGIASDPVNVSIMNPWRVASYQIILGQLVSGGISNAQTSDDTYLVVKKFIVPNSQTPPIQVTFTGQTSAPNSNGLAVSLEDGVNTVGLARTIELYNFNTNQYEAIDTRAATTSDSVTIASATGNVSRFIDGSGNVTCKVNYYQTGPVTVSIYQARFDRVAFLAN